MKGIVVQLCELARLVRQRLEEAGEEPTLQTRLIIQVASERQKTILSAAIRSAIENGEVPLEFTVDRMRFSGLDDIIHCYGIPIDIRVYHGPRIPSGVHGFEEEDRL